MTAVSVVDASAIAAVVFGEAEGEAVQARLSGSRLIAPALLPFELASVCAKKLKHHPGQAKAILAQWRALREVPIELCGVDFDAVVRLAHASRLTAYDASYLWLARDRRAALVTLDARLAAAAR